MKKIFALLLVMAMAFSLVACSNPGTTESQPTSSDAGTQESTPVDNTDAPENLGTVEGVGGTIMFLSSVSSGPTYDALMCILEGMGDALGYDIKVVYGDMQNDPNGNLTAVKNGMTDDVKAIISMQDGGIQNIMDEYPELYVVGYTTAMDSVYSEGGASAAAASNDHFLGSVSGDYVDAARIGQMFAEKVIENGYHKVSTMIFPPFAYPDMVVKDAAFRATIQDGADPVEYLKKLPYNELRELCTAASASASGPVQDGVIYQGTVIDGKFTKQASKYPLIVSSTFSEMFAGNLQPMMFAAPGLNDVKQLTPGDPMVHLTEKYGDAAETIAKVFQAAYPSRDLIDAIYVDTGRTSFIDMATNKANSGGNVWLAMFSYKLPLLGGVESWHTGGDVPFLFHNVSRLGYQIAGDEVNARAYQDVCASALIAYAYTGNPSTEQLSWPQYTVENGASMVFDLESYVGYHHDAELLKLVEENTQASS